MTEEAAAIVWLSLAMHLGVGVCVAILTLLFGLGKLDIAAASMPLRVRVLILPGLAVLWPLVVARLLNRPAMEDRS